MKMMALVTKDLKNCVHKKGLVREDSVPSIESLPTPKALLIEDGDNGFYLYYLNHKGEIQADGWHTSINSAMEQAFFEFAITREEWKDVEP